MEKIIVKSNTIDGDFAKQYFLPYKYKGVDTLYIRKLVLTKDEKEKG